METISGGTEYRQGHGRCLVVLVDKGWRAGTWGGDGIAMRVTDPSESQRIAG